MSDREYKNAWLKFKKIKMQEYSKLHQTLNQAIKPNNQFQLFQISNSMIGKNDLAHTLKQMDKLDGTNEFRNLLNDLERGE